MSRPASKMAFEGPEPGQTTFARENELLFGGFPWSMLQRWKDENMSRAIVIGFTFQLAAVGHNTQAESVNYQRWDRGVSSDPSFFPIAVWLQAPKNAPRFRDVGINLYVGLWKGPTEGQLRALKEAAMPTICAQNEIGLSSANADIIVGWMHGDEPDNAQARRDGKGYDPPILPSEIVARYERIRQRDASRPVLLNLGQGVAFDPYIGRGVRRNHPEDYPEYLKGCDIASFDIYPAVHRNEAVAGKLEFVAKGVERSAAGRTTRESSGTASSAVALAVHESNPLLP